MDARPHWQPAYIGIGSNLDAPRERVIAAGDALCTLPQTRVLCVSRPYHSAPVGFLDQPPFVNAAAAVLTQLAPVALLRELRRLEGALGKTAPTVRYGPRHIDLDLLVYGCEVVDTPELTVPHPRLHERAFVLYPLAELAPALWIPGRGRVATLRDAADGTGVGPLTS